MIYDPLLKLAFRLFLNGLHFQYLKWSGNPGRPQAISLEITHRCVAKCIMCNIWKIPAEVQDLSVSEWLRFLSSDVLSDVRELDITGGEPFLRKDLPELFSGICTLKNRNLKALRSIAITTNGLLTEQVLSSCEEILPMLHREKLGVVVVCAMDAAGPLHDQIRNYQNAWSKLQGTILGLKDLRERYPNLIIGLKTTVLPVNIGELEKIALYAESHGLFTIISPCIITEGRYLNPDRAESLEFSPGDREELVRFYESDLFPWSCHAEALAHYFKTGAMKKPCSCGFNYFFVRSTGEVFPCPLVDRSVGNMRDHSVNELLFSQKARSFRRNIGDCPECRDCTEPGLERYALPYEGFTYLTMLLKKGRNDFLQLHHHMGLDKY